MCVKFDSLLPHDIQRIPWEKSCYPSVLVLMVYQPHDTGGEKTDSSNNIPTKLDTVNMRVDVPEEEDSNNNASLIAAILKIKCF